MCFQAARMSNHGIKWKQKKGVRRPREGARGRREGDPEAPESRKTTGWRFSTSHATNCPPRAPLTPRNDGSLKEQADHTTQHGVPAG